MLKTSVFFAFLALSAVADDASFFKVLIREVDNPAGTLQNGQPCGDFGYLGLGCNVYLQAAVSATGQNVSSSNTLTSTNPINTQMENRISNLNLVVLDANAGNAHSFNGFDLHILISSDQAANSIIDDYVIHVDTTQSTGVYSYTHQRDSTLSTTISIAWSTNISPPSTTSTPEPTTTEVPFTGSTLPPTTTPKPPMDCSEISNLTSSGVQTIYPNGSPVQVYCDTTSYGTYTVIQSRGATGENVNFNITYDKYTDIIGTPGKETNFWFGLDNMNHLSGAKPYRLQIDLCCGTLLVAKQIYHSFKVGTAEYGYNLTATADISGIGLAYSSTYTDLGAKFSTFDNFTGPLGKDDCDEFQYFDDSGVQSQPYGGWWYGSCGNNLNGFWYPKRNGNCTVPDEVFKNTTMLGINMRTTSGQGYGGYNVDMVSYDRVRMALFTFDSITINRTDSSFCS
ncbi:Fibrinogen C-terminal domain-containing protein [Caenorhabditis elegans]|uniref:Fibrinogen C-terminal domain-containing protein n=1 Tax=Caenorhabditis elegans TaxID=6239 RepID=Q9XXE9_CAEEL|nr:Fibrinogen C-terminal domain-containing protein [Caenorhabditis elegans]CAA19505.1 Fibrinogen C-terminal domain-containing protein [Caenorhabditis elegans]|eukprot:NP_501883.1 Uncharacterized protein CELE_Y43C5A.2 [Caenorhabditis elegans]